MSIGRAHSGISFSSRAVSFFAMASSLSGNRTSVTFTLAMVAVRFARSVSRRASNQKAPKTGSFLPLSSTATAARPERRSPSNFSD